MLKKIGFLLIILLSSNMLFFTYFNLKLQRSEAEFKNKINIANDIEKNVINIPKSSQKEISEIKLKILKDGSYNIVEAKEKFIEVDNSKLLEDIENEENNKESLSEEEITLELQNSNIVKGKRISVSREDYECLLRIVEAEATGQDKKGKILVANVILNRLEDGWGETIRDVVFEKNQFAPIKDGRYYTVEITETTREACREALDGVDYSKGALYFMCRKLANPKNARWFDEDLVFLFKYDVHEFFKEKD